MTRTATVIDDRIAVLIVDDEPDNAGNLADILSDLNYRVDVALDGQSALDKLRNNAYTFALLDYQMPGMNGAELYKQMKQIQPCLVAVMVTAYAGSDGVQQAIDAGTWRVLRKPVDPRELLSLLSEASNQPLVLIVDDDLDFSKTIWEVLRAHGFRVCTAATASEAKARFNKLAFDILLLDLKLGPKESGESVFYASRETEQKPSTYLVTGFSSENDRNIKKLRDDGVRGVFSKPLDLPSLIDQIKMEASND